MVARPVQMSSGDSVGRKRIKTLAEQLWELKLDHWAWNHASPAHFCGTSMTPEAQLGPTGA